MPKAKNETNRKLLDYLWKMARDARCVEDFFGVEFGLLSVSEQEQYFLRIETLIKTIDPNEYNYGFLSLINLFSYLKEWAKESIHNNRYGQRLPYRLEIVLQIVKKNNNKYFSNPAVKHSLKSIDAIFFEGEVHLDKYQIRRGSQIIMEGTIEAYGTHGRREVFMSKTGTPHGILYAKDFNLHDQLIIWTWKYGKITKNIFK